jgi:hypothetical protein
MSWTTRKIAGFWNRFFFEPESAAAAGFVRILFGFLAVAWGVLVASDLEAFFGPYGVLSPETQPQVVPFFRINFLMLAPDSLAWLWAFFSIYMLGALMLTLGLFTRVGAVLVFLGLVSFSHRNPFILNSGDTLLRAMSFYLIFLPGNAAYSLDRLIAVARANSPVVRPKVAPWALRMIQIQLCICYLSTALWKSAGGMWWDGTALYYASNLYEFQRFKFDFLFDELWKLKLGTWITLLLEFALPFLLWVPKLRNPLIFVGVAFHFGIEMTMNIPLFQYVMICSVLSFVRGKDLEKAGVWIAKRLGPKLGPVAHVYFDGECEFCRRSADVIRVLDVLARFEWVNFRKVSKSKFDLPRAEKEMLLLTPEGEWLGGFYAFRWMSWKMPLTMPIAWALYLPGIAQAGPWAYAWVASHRYLFLGRACDAEGGACGIHR